MTWPARLAAVRRLGVTLVLGVILGVGACAHGPRILARGTLAYDVAAAGPLVASIELDTAFALVLRRGDATVSAPLGPPDRDFVAVTVDGNGDRIAVAGLDGTVRLFDARGAEHARFRLDEAATAVALSADGSYLLHGAASGVLCLRRSGDGALLQCVAAHDGRIAALAADGDTAVSAGSDGEAIVWALPSLRILARHAAGAPLVALAARTGRVALARAAAPVLVWSWADDRVAESPPAASAVAFLPDGSLARLAPEGAILAGARLLGRSQHPLRGLAVAPDGHWLYVAGWTGTNLDGASLQAFPLP